MSEPASLTKANSLQYHITGSYCGYWSMGGAQNHHLGVFIGVVCDFVCGLCVGGRRCDLVPGAIFFPPVDLRPTHNS
jgi:hypothetical protein